MRKFLILGLVACVFAFAACQRSSNETPAPAASVEETPAATVSPTATATGTATPTATATP